MWLCPLPSRRLKPTLQLASHSHCSSLSPPPTPHKQTDKWDVWSKGEKGGQEERVRRSRMMRRASQQFVRARGPHSPWWQWEDEGSLLWLSLVMYGLISVPAAQSEIRTLPLEQHSMTQLPTVLLPQAALLKYHCRWKAGGGRRVKKIKKNQPFSSVAITITTSTSVTAAQVRRFCCFLAPPFGGCKLCSTPVRPQTF